MILGVPDAGIIEILQSSGGLLAYLLAALSLWKMAQRKGLSNPWFAWIPILNLITFFQLARKPAWWIILFLIPVVNIVIIVIMTMAICENFGVNKWAGLLTLIPLASIVLFLYLAFGTEDTAAPVAAPVAAPSEAPPATDDLAPPPAQPPAQ